MNRKRVVLLGSTGSIGESVLKVARDIPDRMEIVALAANTSAAKLAAQANEFRPAAVCIVDEIKVEELRSALNYTPQLLAGENGLSEIAAISDADMVLISIVGTGGLRPALSAIAAGRDLAVASKEILVMAGEIVMGAAGKKGVRVLPVDSEHNAIFQCLDGRIAGSERRTSNAEHRTSNEERTSSEFDVRRSTFDVSELPGWETSNAERRTPNIERRSEAAFMCAPSPRLARYGVPPAWRGADQLPVTRSSLPTSRSSAGSG